MKKAARRFIILILICPSLLFAQTNVKLRVLVLSDIEADPDDTQSFIRLLTYSNQWDIEGLIATTSIHQKGRVAPESILKILDAYKKVQPNLLKHEPGFPAYEDLKGKVKKGLAVYGMEGVGERKNSEGSDWIVKVLEKNETGPGSKAVAGFTGLPTSPMPQRGDCTTALPRTVALSAIRLNCQAKRITLSAERHWSQR